MFRFPFLFPVLACALEACLPSAQAANTEPDMTANPFAQRSTLPFELPPFASIHDADYAPAFAAGMQEQLREVTAVSQDRTPPTFDNTVLALERSGALLKRVSKVFRNLSSADGTPAMRQLEQQLAPRLAAHRDAIHLDAPLFVRIKTLHEQGARLGLDPESMQLLERTYIDFVRAGALLGDSDKTRLRAINAELASASTRFRLNVLKATQDGAVGVADVAELDGLSPADISAAAAAAQARGSAEKYLITLQNTTVQPVLSTLTNRALRERVFKASATRATSGPNDNRQVIAEIMRLRAERAVLLGYATPADYVLQDETAGTPAAVNRLLRQIAPVAMAAARKEAAAIQQLIDHQARAAQRESFALQPWDWAFYAEQVRKERFAFDEAAVKPYFELDRVLRDGAFHAAHELYGLSFVERSDLHAYRDQVRVFEVRDADGTPLGLFLADFFARDSKQGGAWMNSYVDQSELFGTRPVVSNNLNLAHPGAGQPVLLGFDEVTTLFHEFGHALHGLLSKVRYASLSGTNVPRDFVEYLSQYNEMWAREPQVLAHFARHYQTGEPMPKALFDKVLAAQTFDQGFETSSYLAAALLDQAWHQVGPGQLPDAAGVEAFEAAALRSAGMDFAPVAVRYHSPYFLHVYSHGYEAAYYAYLWSEVLARDTGKWFHTHGGMTRANGDYLRAKILSRGRTVDPSRLFEEFYGGPPDGEPLLEYRGLK